MKMIKTKSVFEPKSDDDGIRVLITRYYPRGVKKGHFDEWMRALAPSKELLKEYKDKKIEWNEFEKQFLNQMTNQDSETTIQTLASRARKNNITLLCYEKNGHNCHRYLVHDLITNQLHV
ncbi:MAG TPA: DUF488 family protein [Candidatus Acidoferrum sp.]|nr:DUF488 family protein [Candidatus Acidoferrum sp.]